MGLPLAIGLMAGGGLLSGLFGSKKKDPEWSVAPEYPEAQGARGTWWEKLQSWGADPNYGAISPDWGRIWDQAKGRVQRYFWGGPLEPGLVGKVKSSLARRNVSESPASEDLIARMGMQEGLQLQDLATDQATQEAAFGEQGRQTWLQSLMGLAQQKPVTQMYQPAQNENWADFLGTAVSGAGSLIGQDWLNQNWLSKLGSVPKS